MNKLFLPYNIALSLKEIGFDEPCIAFYWGSDSEMLQIKAEEMCPSLVPQKKSKRPEGEFWPFDYNSDKKKEIEDFTRELLSAPLYDQVIDWFIDNHLTYCYAFMHMNKWNWKVDRMGSYAAFSKEGEYFKSRKEALNAGIEKCIQLIKEKR